MEANEALASQSVVVGRELDFDMNQGNVNGGAISIGHPIGCSGARIIVTQLYEMLKRPYLRRALPCHVVHRWRYGHCYHL